MEERRGGRGYVEATLGALELPTPVPERVGASTGALAGMERVEDKLQTRSIRGEVLTERLDTVPICSLHKMLGQSPYE